MKCKSFVLVGDDFPASQTLDLLLRAGARVALAFSTPRSRGFGLLGARARASGVPVYPSDVLSRSAGLERLSTHDFDWLVNINSTLVLPAPVLERPRAGALNMHPGRLPDYAGLHTHQWAIRNGESEFASTVHFMDENIDTGDIVAERSFPVEPSDTGLKLFLKCMREGTAVMHEVVTMIIKDLPLPRRPQDLSRRRLYRDRDAKDGRIDWSWTAVQVERFIRAGNYEPLSSPSYTAHLDPVDFKGDSVRIEVLRGSVLTSPRFQRPPGRIFQCEGGRAVVCGDGAGLKLERTRLRSKKDPLSMTELKRFVPDGTVLEGRR